MNISYARYLIWVSEEGRMCVRYERWNGTEVDRQLCGGITLQPGAVDVGRKWARQCRLRTVDGGGEKKALSTEPKTESTRYGVN